MKKFFRKFFSSKKSLLFLALGLVCLFVIIVAYICGAKTGNVKEKDISQQTSIIQENSKKLVKNTKETSKESATKESREEIKEIESEETIDDATIGDFGDEYFEAEEENDFFEYESDSEEETPLFRGINGMECDGNGHYAFCQNYREVFASYLTDEEINAWIIRHPSGIYDNSEGWVINTDYAGSPPKSELQAIIEATVDRVAREEISEREAEAIIKNHYDGGVFVYYNYRMAGQVFQDASARMLHDGYIFNDCGGNEMKDLAFLKYYGRYNQAEDTAEVAYICVSLD